MAIAFYNNGIIEEFAPKDQVFTDKEILNIFKEYKKIRTKRITEVQNTWGIWGEDDKHVNEDDFSKIASDILEENIFSIVIFVHDSEINTAWMPDENVIEQDYGGFKKDMMGFLDFIAEQNIKETQKMRKKMGQENNLIFLDAIGPTEDKKILFKFNPHTQSEEFYKEENFIFFANKIISYIISNYKNKDTFFIFEDNKIRMFVEDEHVEFIMNKFIDNLLIKEKYEECKELKDKYEEWKEFKSKKENKPRRKGRDSNNEKKSE